MQMLDPWNQQLFDMINDVKLLVPDKDKDRRGGDNQRAQRSWNGSRMVRNAQLTSRGPLTKLQLQHDKANPQL